MNSISKAGVLSNSGLVDGERQLVACINRIERSHPVAEPVLAVMIKTFTRPESLVSCLGSIFSHPPGVAFRVYIADDGRVTRAQELVYDALQAKGHVVRRFPFQTGATRCRNSLITDIDEPYVLRLDDDFEFLPETDVDSMLRILEARPDVGCVADVERQLGLGKGVLSGRLSPFQGYLRRKGDILIKNVQPIRRFRYENPNGVAFCNCDFTRNFLLCRTAIFRDVRWEERLHFQGEHLDFMLQLQNSKWGVGFTPASVHAHNETNRNWRFDGRSSDNVSHRVRRPVEDVEWRRVFEEKWGITQIRIEAPLSVQLQRAAVRMVRRLGG